MKKFSFQLKQDILLPTSTCTLTKELTCKRVAHSLTVRVIGPRCSKLDSMDQTPVKGTRPNVGLRLTIPHQLEGIRIEPPRSLPIAMSAAPAPT